MKKILKSLLILAVIFAACTILNPTKAQAASIDDLTFTLNEDGNSYSVTDCNTSASGELTIPSTYNGKPVTIIGNFAFEDCASLISVTIGTNITAIGDYAFGYCSNLTTVKALGSITTIGESAFCRCTSLTNVTIPDSVTTIDDNAFVGCTNLSSIFVDENNPSYSSDGYGVLFNKGKTTLVAVPGATKSYTIPNSVTTIGNSAFSSCTSLTSITIPNSVTTIGNSAFSSCTSLTSITIPNSVATIGDSSFRFCDSLTGITIPANVTSIGRSAFYYCTSLVSVTIPNGVTTIGYSAFYYCSSLTDVGYTGTQEQWNAIAIGSQNQKLQNATLHFVSHCTTYGHMVEILPSKAATCTETGLTEGKKCSICGETLVAQEETPALGHTEETVLAKAATCTENGLTEGKKCSVCGEILVEQTEIISGHKWIIVEGKEPSCTETGLTEGKKCSVCGEILVAQEEIPALLTFTLDSKGQYYTLTDCATSVTGEVTIPAAYKDLPVTAIGPSAFSGCTKVQTINIPTSVQKISYGAFYNCTGLKEITIPEGVTDIQYSTFGGCTSLVSVSLPDSVVRIGELAFDNCKSLTTVNIPEGVTTIGRVAFFNCRSLDGIALPKTLTTLGDSAFYDCKALTAITIPGTIARIEKSTFYGCSKLEAVVIEEGVETIDEYAFYNCIALKSVTIPESVTYIGSYAFDNCTGLTDVYFGGNQTQWDAYALGSSNAPLLNATLHLSGPCAEGHTYDHDFDGICNVCDEARQLDNTYRFENYRVVFADPDTTHKNLRVEVYSLGDATVEDPADEKALRAIDSQYTTRWNAGNINKILLTDAGNYVLLLKYNIGTGSAIKVPMVISVSADPKLIIDKNNKITGLDSNAANINHRVVVYYLGENTVEDVYDEAALLAIDSAPETHWQMARINRLALTKGGNYVLHLCYNEGVSNKITVAQQFTVESIPSLSVNNNNKIVVTEENAENRNHRAVVYYLGENTVEDPYDESSVTTAAVTTSKTYWGLTEINALELKEGGSYVIHLYYNVGTSEKRTLALDVTLNERPALSIREDNHLVVSYSDPDITNPRAYIYNIGDNSIADIYDEAALKAIATPTQVWGLSSILNTQLTESGTYVIHFCYNVGTGAKKTVALKVTI